MSGEDDYFRYQHRRQHRRPLADEDPPARENPEAPSEPIDLRADTTIVRRIGNAIRDRLRGD